MKSTTFKLFYLMALIFISTCLCTGVFAADPEPGDSGDTVAQEGDPDQDQDQDPDEPAESVFQNPTQALRAENLAKAYAEKPDPELEEALDKVKQAEDDLKNAEADLENAEEEGEIEEAEKALQEAEDALAEAKKEADEKMAEDAGVTAEEIGDMRAEGMGWGEICHELGLHPSVLGMRHAKAYKNKKGWGEEDPEAGGEVSDKEVKAATQRNFKSGLSKGHGADADKGNKSADKTAKGKDKAVDKDKSSNKGGNGKGGGKKK